MEICSYFLINEPAFIDKGIRDGYIAVQIGKKQGGVTMQRTSLQAIDFLKLFIIMVAVVSIIQPLQAGTSGKISGIVTDVDTGTPLPGVNVVLEGQPLGASTDLKGQYYIINVPVGVYSIHASMIGYTEMRVKAVKVLGDLTTQIDFKLSTRVLEAGQIVEVVADRPMVQKDLTSGRSIVSAEDIKEMPVESVSGIIQTKAGIVTDAGGAIHIRGGRSSEVSYLIDGVPMTNPAWGGISSTVENNAVQELQILSGTFNAEYGQAMSGVINIVTKEGSRDYQGSLSGYMGDYYTNHTKVFEHAKQYKYNNIKNLEGSFSGPVPGFGEKLSFFTSGRYYQNGGYLRGEIQHQPGDVNYLSTRTVEELLNSPYGKAGLLHVAEPFDDLNGDGKLASGSEAYIDFDGNGHYTPGEPFRDVNGNGRYDHPGVDLDGDGFLNPEELEFIDLNGNGVLDGDPFIDTNNNGVLDGEPYIDFNHNGRWDSGASGSGEIVRLNHSQRYNVNTKFTWRITPKAKLNYNVLYNRSTSQSYSLAYKYNPLGRGTNNSYSLSQIVDFTHSLSNSFFYNLKGSYYVSESKTYYNDLLPNELIKNEHKDFTTLDQLISYAQSEELATGEWYGNRSDSLLVLKSIVTINDTASGATVVSLTNPEDRTYSVGDSTETLEVDFAGLVEYFKGLIGNEGWAITVDITLSDIKNNLVLPNNISYAPPNEYYGGGHNHGYTSRKNQTLYLAGNLTWQFNNIHQFKAGLGYKHHIMDYQTFTTEVSSSTGWIPDGKTPETSLSNDNYNNWLSDTAKVGRSLAQSNRTPREYFAYFQDKIELVDMIVNIGLRYDYFDPNYFVPGDYKDPDDPKYFLYTTVDTVDGVAYQDTSVASEKEYQHTGVVIDTLNASGGQWVTYGNFYKPVQPVHQFSPRIGVAYPITDKGIIHFSYGHFFQIPTFAYLYANPEFEIGADNASILGNAALKPQKTVKYEIGLQQELAPDLAIEVIAFYQDFSGLLSSELKETYNGTRYSIYSNTDYGNSRGVTFSLTKRRTGLFSAAVDYTYQISKGNASDPKAQFYANQSDPPAEVEKKTVFLNWDQRHTLNANLSLSEPNKWGVSFLIKYGSGLPYTPSIQGFQIDKPNSDRKPPEYSVDVNAHKDFSVFGKRIVFFAKIYNLFDTMNERYVFNDTGRATYSLIPTYTPDKGNDPGRHSLSDYLNRPSYFSAPRQFRIGLQFGL